MRKPRQIAALSKMEEKFNAAQKKRQEAVAEVKRTGMCMSCKKSPATIDGLWCQECMDLIRKIIQALVKK